MLKSILFYFFLKGEVGWGVREGVVEKKEDRAHQFYA
jgi:hypothetical protein